MISRHLSHITNIFAFMAILACAWDASAQDCTIAKQVISKLQKPSAASYHLWTSEYGELETNESFRSAITLPKNRVLAAGEVEYPLMDKRNLLFAEIDYRGRVISKKEEPLEGLDHVAKLLPFGEGFIVAATTRAKESRAEIYLAQYDSRGSLVRSKIIKTPKTDLTAVDMIERKDGGYVLLVSAQYHAFEKSNEEFSMVYLLDNKLEIKDKRSFKPGAQNHFHRITKTKDEKFLVSGEIERRPGQKAGWISVFNDKMDLLWQQTYSRGRGASLHIVQPLDEFNLVAAGFVESVTADQPKGAWIMMVNAFNGEIVWERFFTADYDLAGKDMVIGEDKQITAILAASNAVNTEEHIEEGFEDVQVVEKFLQDHMKIVHLNRRGVVMGLEFYFNGRGFLSHQLANDNDKAIIMVGDADIEYLEDVTLDASKAKDIDINISRDAVIVAAPRPDPYKDPCKDQF